MKTVKFKGVPSGNGESFCFDVDRKTFVQVTGRDPEDTFDYQNGEYLERGDELIFVPGDDNKCRLYPNDLFGYESQEIEVEIRIK